MGDLNANMLSTSPTTFFIKDLAYERNLKLVEHGAANHVRDSHTWIDLILTDDDNVVLCANNVMALFPNSHNIIEVEIDFQSAKPPSLNRFMYRDFKSIKLEELLSLLASCDWTPISRLASGVELELDHLIQNIMSVIDQLAPLKQFNPRRKGLPPWVGADLQELYRQRDAVQKRYKRTQHDTFRREFQSLAGEAEQRTYQAKEAFIQTLLCYGK